MDQIMNFSEEFLSREQRLDKTQLSLKNFVKSNFQRARQ